MLRTIFITSALIAAAAGCYRSSRFAPATDGTTYVAAHGMVPAGTTAWAKVEQTGLDGGLVRARTVADVRSADGEEVLIPEGAILVGRVTASNGLDEVVVFETIEMADVQQRISADVVTDGNTGLTNLQEGTKIQIRFREALPALSSVRGKVY
jgi:hypothetical protein